jgi:hypothetical protein
MLTDSVESIRTFEEITMDNARSLLFTSVICVAVLAAGCGHSSSSAADSSSQDSGGSQDASGSAATGTATGHLHLTGAVSLEHDFTVDACVIGPAGDGLLDGYHMNAKDGDKAIDILSVVVKDYAKDGSYAPADKSAGGQVNAAMTSGVMGPVTLMVAQADSPAPLAVMLKPDSTMNIQISDNGAKGDAEFTDMGTPMTMADLDPNGPTKGQGKKISGSITWSCGTVEHIDPKMNDAVNGTFKKLIPNP